MKQKISGCTRISARTIRTGCRSFLHVAGSGAIVRWPTQLSTITWTYTATNRVLIEAGVAPGESPDTITQPPEKIAGVPIFELGGPDVPFSFAHRASWFADNDDRLPSQTFKGSLSYVTGSHNFKVGTQLQRDTLNGATATTRRVTTTSSRSTGAAARDDFSPLAGWVDRLNYNLGIYAQDSWTTKRLTLSGGVRLDFQNESVDAYHYGPGPWMPNRNVNYPEIKNVPNWKDVNPRINGSYDLLGNGKTAIKASVSRSVLQDSIGVARANDPAANALVTSTEPPVVRQQRQQDAGLRSVQSGAAEFFGPAFDPTRDLCGPWNNANFGNPALATTWDPRFSTGGACGP